ncbi:MAG: sulfotransferase [Cyanobacteria bacterium P01_F01_bin.86]
MMTVIPPRFKGRLRKFNKRLQTEWYIDYSSDYRDAVFLAGVSRSGTTWLSDVLNYKNQYRYMFEPFYPKEVELCQNLDPKQYLAEDSKDEKFLEIANQVLSGNVRSYWADRFNAKSVSNRRLIKAIRANLFLKWLHKNFPELPIIFLIRHPVAVAVSKVKLDWQRSLDKYLRQADLMNDFLYPFKDEIVRSEEQYKQSGNTFENHIFSWCIENYVPLKQFRPDEMHIVFYENCCTDPESETRRLFSYLGQNYDESILDKINSASKLSRKDSAINTGKNLVSSWQKHVTDVQMKRAIEILELFNLNQIYSSEPMPCKENLSRLMRS